MKRGVLMIVSGPSGSGKGTIVKQLENDDNIKVSVSATTRKPRAGEEHGVHYYFMEKYEFLNRVDDGEMLEYNEYCGNHYGTPLMGVEPFLKEGKDVILEIDVNGARQISKIMKCVKLFILPPNVKVLKERLCLRGTETEEVLNIRLNQAHVEMEQAYNYDYLVVNDNIDDAVNKVKSILIAERHRAFNMKDKLDELLK
ncbi:MAG: guanylate kinase [Oscillospiraceae bacterium]|nr:guanylate kinase [Oscillospiraceae bacterium]